MKTHACFIAILLICVCTNIAADANVEAGQRAAAICAGCHGKDGYSSVPQWPSLAGQNESYLLRQLRLIKTGARAVPEMSGIVGSMSEQSLADISAYYAQLASKSGLGNSMKVKPEGEDLWNKGNPDTGLPACASCHGANGEGISDPDYPALASQNAAYTARMLGRFRSGEFWGDDDTNSKLMSEASKALSNKEIETIALYIERL